MRFGALNRAVDFLIRVHRRFDIEREFPISSCLDPSNAPSSTGAKVVSLTDAVNHPVKLTKPSVGVVNWRSMGSGGGFHHVCSPFQLLRARTSPLGYLSSPHMTPRTNHYAGAGESPAIPTNTSLVDSTMFGLRSARKRHGQSLAGKEIFSASPMQGLVVVKGKCQGLALSDYVSNLVLGHVASGYGR